MATITSADYIVPTITSVSSAAKPVVSFKLADRSGKPYQGATLTGNAFRFVLAQLAPGTGGKSSEWTRLAYERNADGYGTLVDNKNGTYTYTFKTDVTTVAGYSPTLTTRVGFQLSGPEAENGVYTYQPSSGATTGLFSREIADDDTCNTCHDDLEGHGNRRNIQYCVVCHTSTLGDVPANAAVGEAYFPFMVHQIHFNKGPWATDEFPQDARNCQTCHDDSDAKTPQAVNWKTVPNISSCGSCHDDINFANPVGSDHEAIGPATDADCAFCHGPDSTLFGGALKPENAHKIPLVEAAKKFEFKVLAVTNTAPGQFPVVKFSVTDPSNAGAAYNIQTAAPFTVCNGTSRLSIDIAWTTADYTNGGTTVLPGQPVQINPLTACGGASTNNGDGTFSVTSPVAVPLIETGTLIAALEGHPAVDVDSNGVFNTADRVPVKNAYKLAAMTGSEVPRRAKVALSKCNECHKTLSLHGNNRTDELNVCFTCHAPNATDINQRVAGSACETVTGTLDDQSIDMKYMAHRLHASGETEVPYGVCGFGNNGYLFEVAFPGKLNNCEGCHVKDGFYPVNAAVVAGTTMDANLTSTFADDAVTSPNAAVCSSCHTSDLARAHIDQNGGYFEQTGVKDAVTGKMIAGADIETCDVCHGQGRSADLRVMHEIDTFKYNK